MTSKLVKNSLLGPNLFSSLLIFSKMMIYFSGEYMAKIYGGKIPVGDSRASIFSYYKQDLYAHVYVHSMQNGLIEVLQE